MKRNLLFSVLLVLGFSISRSYGQQGEEVQLPDYPSYKMVMTKFLEKYSIAEVEYPEELQLVKMMDGWHARVVDLATKDVKKDELYWNRSKDRFMKVDFPDGGNDLENENVKQLIDHWRNNYFTQISPFWGYAGWDVDVIDEYGDVENLSDTLLNALARAYASFASNCLNNNTGYSLDAYSFDLPKGQNALNADQLNFYREMQHKAIAAYYKLWQKNPRFESFVSDAYNIYSNEIMNAYLTIRYHMNIEEARKELKDGLYDDFTIEMAKNYLSSCDSNAIFFVHGDGDTYPLLYVQENEGFRKDVSVINYSMMGSGRYVTHLIDDGNSGAEVTCTLSKGFYEDERRQVIYVNEVRDSVHMTTMLEFLASEDMKTKVTVGEEYYSYVPTRSLYFEYEGRGADGDGIFRMKMGRNYLMINHVAFLDIVSTNAFRRPVYFSMSSARESFMGLDEYLQLEGLAYRLMPVKFAKEAIGPYPGHINADKLYDVLMNSLQIEKVRGNEVLFEAQGKMVAMYRMCYQMLTEVLIGQGQNEKALKVLDFIYEAYPGTVVPYGYFGTRMLRSLYKLGEEEKANAMVEEMRATAEESIRSLGTEVREGQIAKYILSELDEIEREY